MTCNDNTNIPHGLVLCESVANASSLVLPCGSIFSGCHLSNLNKVSAPKLIRSLSGTGATVTIGLDVEQAPLLVFVEGNQLASNKTLDL